MSFSGFRCAFLSVLVLTIGQSTAQTTAQPRLDEYLDQAHKRGTFNGNVLIAEHGKMVLLRAIGDASASHDALKLSDRFHIGSIAKEFDAVGILMLAEQHRLSLTDPVSKFFPDLPAWAETITLNELLYYTSGLPEVDWKTVHSDADNWRNLHSLQKLDSAPGTRYAYNNNNTFLRRKVIEKVTGSAFKDFVEKREFPVAHIFHGVVDPTDLDVAVAKSFDANYKQDSLQVPISGWTALTIEDFFHWSECIRHFCLISPASTSIIANASDPSRQTGFGHLEIASGEVSSHVHDGSALHYQALLMFDGAKDQTILLLSNQKRDALYDLAEGIKAILAEDSTKRGSDHRSRYHY